MPDSANLNLARRYFIKTFEDKSSQQGVLAPVR
jgi:hypothetical protein